MWAIKYKQSLSTYHQGPFGHVLTFITYNEANEIKVEDLQRPENWKIVIYNPDEMQKNE